MNLNQIETAEALKAAGGSIRSIAAELGVTTYAVRSWMEEATAIKPPPEGNGPKVVFYDIETTPKLGLYFGKEYDTRIAKRLTRTEVLSFAYQWEGGDGGFFGSWEDPNWRPGLLEQDRDEWVLRRLWDMFDQADVVVAHNGDGFDQKKSNGRFLRYGMTPPSHYIEVDTLKISRTFFGLDSHRLDDLADFLGLEGKVSHSGIDLWKGCMEGDLADQATMGEYNVQDTALLEEVYGKMEPWVGFNGRGRKFNRALWGADGVPQCPNCGGYDLKPNGFRETATTRKQSYLCACGARPTERTMTQKKKGVVLT